MGAPLGNKNAGKEKMIEAALRRELTQDPEKARRIALALCERAGNGDVSAAVFIRDTVDGRPIKRIDVNTEFDNALALVGDEEIRAAVRARMAPFFRAALARVEGAGGEGPGSDQRIN
jgi:hypothetical protein